MAANFDCSDSTDEMWRECASWLTKWEMLRPDHKANWPNACIGDLAKILRDGVLLCRLLHKINPSCIDLKEVNLKPTMAQFLCLRNINLFLKVCNEKFGLKSSDLFEDTMLFDLTNFHKVLCTLSKLSLCDKVLQDQVRGFTAQPLKSKEEEVYTHLPRGMAAAECDFYSDVDIYDVIVVRSPTEQPPTVEKRDFVIKELLDTENNYVDVLKKLERNFMLPLTSWMSTQEHSTVFFKIKELKTIHSEFQNELLRIRLNRSVKLSNIFMRFREKFLIYGAYCANLNKSTKLLQEMCETKELFNQAVIKYEKEDNNGRFKLRDVLSVPMQRILKYHLLLDKLIENTDPNDEEYNDLRRAREAMVDVAGFINEAARDSEQLEMINTLQETITGWTLSSNRKLSDYGRLLKDVELKIKAHHQEPKLGNCYVFIFEKVILICQQYKTTQFRYRALLNIAEYHVEEGHNRAILKAEARYSYCFHLVKDKNMVYTIYVKSMEIKEQVIRAIKDALDNLQPKALSSTDHTFTHQTFPNPVQCNHCSKYLKGLIFQGYKCNDCGISVHKGCIQSSGRCGSPLSHDVTPTTTNGADGDPMWRKLWFVGEMERNVAENLIQHRDPGTYMVRIRAKSTENDKYALTLKSDTVKHMKINSKVLQDNVIKYYLSESRFFDSIEMLVLYYENYSLQENFERLKENTRLQWPFRQLRALVIRNYEPKDLPQLNVVEGEVIIIIGQEGYGDGWWKARTENNETGYVPASVLKVEGEVRFDS